jgi:hypothetical protein
MLSGKLEKAESLLKMNLSATLSVLIDIMISFKVKQNYQKYDINQFFD